MIAVPFIEYFNSIRLTNIDIKGQDRKILDNIKVVSKLYSQEFKPEMIFDLFVRWEGEGKSLIDYKNRKDAWEYSIIDFSSTSTRSFIYRSYVKTEHIYINNKWELPKPQTLDQFITDCMRAGIELVWKESVVQKYFR